MRSALSLSSVSFLTLLLAACTTVDTTGISAESSKKPAGNPAASIVVTEYADLQCPACKGAHTILTLPLLEKYGSIIRFDYKHFPLRAIHPYALRAAEASECAADQGKFWEYIDIAYEHQEDLAKLPFEEWAKELGLDADLFHRCTASGIKEKAVLAELAAGEKLGVNSTPSYFVNGSRITSNTIEAFDAAIAAARQKIDSMPL